MATRGRPSTAFSASGFSLATSPSTAQCLVSPPGLSVLLPGESSRLTSAPGGSGNWETSKGANWGSLAVLSSALISPMKGWVGSDCRTPPWAACSLWLVPRPHTRLSRGPGKQANGVRPLSGEAFAVLL